MQWTGVPARMSASDTGSLDELLVELERVAAERGLPVVGNLLPGANEEQLAEARDLLDGDLPEDLELLYRWRSGVEGVHNDASLFPGLLGGPGVSYVGITGLRRSLEALERLVAGPSYAIDDLQLGDIPLFWSRFEVIVLRKSTEQVRVLNFEEPESLALPHLSDLLRLVLRLWHSNVFYVDQAEDIAYLDSNYPLLHAEVQPYRLPGT